MSELETNIKISLDPESVSKLATKLADILREHHSDSNKKWINSQAAMELLDISKNTLQKLRDSHAIRVSKPPDIGIFYYDRDSILEYLEKHVDKP